MKSFVRRYSGQVPGLSLKKRIYNEFDAKNWSNVRKLTFGILNSSIQERDEVLKRISILLIRNDLISDAKTLIQNMTLKRIPIDGKIYHQLLSSFDKSNNKGEVLGLYDIIAQSGFKEDSTLMSKLIYALCRYQEYQKAMVCCDFCLNAKLRIQIFVYNQISTHFVHNPLACIQFYQRLEKNGVVLDDFALRQLLKANAEIENYTEALKCFDRLDDNDNRKYTILLDSYVSHDLKEDAENLFHQMCRKFKIDDRIYYQMVRLYSQVRDHVRILDIFRIMAKEKVAISAPMWNMLFESSKNTNFFHKAIQMFELLDHPLHAGSKYDVLMNTLTEMGLYEEIINIYETRVDISLKNTAMNNVVLAYLKTDQTKKAESIISTKFPKDYLFPHHVNELRADKSLQKDDIFKDEILSFLIYAIGGKK